jgi:purine-cytosine permease-like protein
MIGTNTNPDWAAAYASGSVGGLLGAVLAPVGGFGKFCLVLLALSIVANNIPNNYSVNHQIST